MFYLPHFTSGVALFVLWKHLYNPQFGPINSGLREALRVMEPIGRTLPGWLVVAIGGLIVLLAAGFFLFAVTSLLRWRIESTKTDIRTSQGERWRVLESVLLGVTTVGIGAAFFGALAYIMYLGGDWVMSLPEAVQQRSLQPPQWLNSVTWAKPAIMIMGIWTAIGGSNMLLYIAAISNVPSDLYEAAEIDGAGRWARFRYVTWPQLRPTTFFIVIMSLIGGFQGGFAQARVLTQGGPAGSTTTLSYYIFTKGFEAREMGYASAVAWVLFIIIFAITALSWRYGRGGDTDVT
jgi:multiple sugar transport system permease protein